MSGDAPGPAPRELAFAAAFAGAAALAYETLWTRLLGLALGHELLGVLSVLAGFFAGMALGAGLAHRRADALERPARIFALMHTAAAAYAVAAPWLLTWVASWLPRVLGVAPSPVASLALAALVLLRWPSRPWSCFPRRSCSGPRCLC